MCMLITLLICTWSEEIMDDVKNTKSHNRNNDVESGVSGIVKSCVLSNNYLIGEGILSTEDITVKLASQSC